MENQEAFMLETQHVSKHYGLSLIHIFFPKRLLTKAHETATIKCLNVF